MNSLTGINVFIDAKRLVVFQTSDGDNGKRVKTKLFESKLEKNNLPQVLREFKAKNQVDSVSLLFADDLVVTGVIQDESNSAGDREAVGKLVKAKLSIDVEKAVWDYTKVNNCYQIVCLPGDYTSYIAPAFDQAGIKIDSIEPLSVSLAKLLANQAEPRMLVYDDVERLVTICWQGLVFEPIVFIPVELSNKAKKIKTDFKKQFNLEIANAVVSANFADPYVADLTALSLNTEVQPIDPFSGVEIVSLDTQKEETRETVIAGDTKITEIETEKVKAVIDSESEKPENYQDIWQESKIEAKEIDKSVEINKTTETMSENAVISGIQVNTETGHRSKRNLTWLAIVIPLVFTFIVVGYLLISNKNSGELYNPLLESSLGSGTASSSATITTTADKAKLKIQVLNGSGKAGEAAKAKGLLETAGFTVEVVGNATTSSAIKTEIKSKVALSESIKKDFQDALSKLYDIQFIVASVSGYDVVVTVGKSK